MCPRDSDNADELARMADVALYRAKSSGRGGICFYDASIEEAARDRSELLVDLAVAIRQEQFEVHFQPIASAASGAVECFEALLRWQHPELGAVDPAVFIPLAEERR